MGIFSTDKNKITLIYNSKTSLGKQANSYVSTSNKSILRIDLSMDTLTGTQWIEIAQKLNIELSNLINKKHPDFQKTYSEQTELEVNDWLKVIKRHPEVVTYPIVIKGEQFYLLENPSDFVRLTDSDTSTIHKKSI
ncbi:arsenate reductase family protein [Aquimarina muelleri]|uniref:Arsenate reductase n=1 Tax=Aquimarina muelleri TaxID=279356 RepID=A0A918JSV7_9FLAO|nr:hypothetical protein [Aquimarina muelleri]MCX2764359.1 hypothetical protein [Aquimarina muelleri]GGX04903.1 hypothetical protein GCM10007384_03180 [Aquimarina muelleri]